MEYHWVRPFTVCDAEARVLTAVQDDPLVSGQRRARQAMEDDRGERLAARGAYQRGAGGGAARGCRHERSGSWGGVECCSAYVLLSLFSLRIRSFAAEYSFVACRTIRACLLPSPQVAGIVVLVDRFG